MAGFTNKLPFRHAGRHTLIVEEATEKSEMRFLFFCAYNNTSTGLWTGTAVAQWLTLILLTWSIWRALNNVSKWQTGFNSAFKVLRCYATNRKVAGSIPAGAIGIFHWHNPSDRIMALGSTQPLTEMSTRSIFWG